MMTKALVKDKDPEGSLDISEQTYPCKQYMVGV